MSLPETELTIACRTMDLHMESSMEVMSQLSDIYLKNKQLEKATQLVFEMEMLQDEFHVTYETFWESLSLRSRRATTANSTVQLKCMDSLKESRLGSIHKEDKDKPLQPTKIQNNVHEPGPSSFPSIGEDLWKQLKRIQLPVFSGDTRNYRNWKAAFIACVDASPSTGEYKLLQLRQCLSGEALNAIESLGHSACAYEAAKERLERKYGGKRRQVAIYLEDLDKFPQIRSGNAQDMEKFADLLEISIMNLEEAGHHSDLGDGFLYSKLRTKLTESMLAKYHRWIFETQTPESVEALKTLVFQESSFQTIASETLNGFTRNSEHMHNSPPPVSQTWNDQRTFFGELIHSDNKGVKKMTCQLCGRNHKIWACQKFIEKAVPVRWETAKRLKLCFRCLGDCHLGKACQNNQPCGRNGCQKLHHALLHSKDNRRVIANCCLLNGSDDTKTRNITCTFDPMYFDRNDISTHRNTSVMEGKNQSLDSTESSLQTHDRCAIDKRDLTTVSDLLNQRIHKSDVDSASIKPCRLSNVDVEREHLCRSREIPVVRDRRSVLQIRTETEHLIDHGNDKSQNAMEGN